MLSRIPILAALFAVSASAAPAPVADRVPAFSLANLDPSVSPRTNFYQFANGTWIRENPVPADKSRWASFNELSERNWRLIRAILEEAGDGTSAPGSPKRLIADFYASATTTNRLELLRFQPLKADLERIEALATASDGARLVGDWHRRGISVSLSPWVGPDSKDSGRYALYVYQGGLGLPDRDYYLAEGFAKQREEYRRHIATMLTMQGEPKADAEAMAATIIELETELARASRTRTELRDREKNYNRWTTAELRERTPDLAWDDYFASAGIKDPGYVIVGQPDFLAGLNRLATERDLSQWRAYLRWHLLRSTAPYLHSAAERESFRFYGTVLQGQPEPEPRWQIAARAIDACLGEALGQLYVERHYPAEAGARMATLVQNVKEVFRDRLGKLEWMGPATREEAKRKFERFTTKIGHPAKFRDYSAVKVDPADYLGNIQRASAFEFDRDAARIGGPVDRTEWGMTPPTVNAYFSPTQNEIVFPAGILQPPFFDVTADDAVNYGAIGSVIGHEITHGYDDQGRKYDAEGNLHDWWTEADAREFQRRAARVVEQYGAYEPLPGSKVNGQLTLGENIADLGGVSIAFEALQRVLAKEPAKRVKIGGYTPEQRFFLAYAQAWRSNTREAEIQRRLVVDSHAPPQYRGFGPLVNLAEFHAAFGVQPGDPMWVEPERRAVIW